MRAASCACRATQTMLSHAERSAQTETDHTPFAGVGGVPAAVRPAPPGTAAPAAAGSPRTAAAFGTAPRFSPSAPMSTGLTPLTLQERCLPSLYLPTNQPRLQTEDKKTAMQKSQALSFQCLHNISGPSICQASHGLSGRGRLTGRLTWACAHPGLLDSRLAWRAWQRRRAAIQGGAALGGREGPL